MGWGVAWEQIKASNLSFELRTDKAITAAAMSKQFQTSDLFSRFLNSINEALQAKVSLYRETGLLKERELCNFEGHLPISAVQVGSVTKYYPVAQGLAN